MAGKVLVTGGSGYIGGELIRQLLAKGWTVHTTVRNLSSETRVRPLLGGTPETLKFFAADLTHDAGWAEAMAGCSHLAHVASPFPVSEPRDADELVVPARDGALRALRFARDAGVRRVVLTSSAAAIAYGHGKGERTYTENDWTDLNGTNVTPYVKSKTIAEGEARDWIATNGDGMEFATVNPVAVFGPVASDDFAASVEAVRQFLDGKVPGCPDIGFAIVDVRDVADLHVRVLETEKSMANERFIASGDFFKLIDVARVLKAELGDKARKVPTRRLPDWLVRLLALFNPTLRQVAGELGRVRRMDASHAFEVLGWKARDERETLRDCALSLIARGIVKP